MVCTPVTDKSGRRMIVCTGRRAKKLCACGAKSTLLCDHPSTKNKSGTCDAPLCAKCAVKIGPDIDSCPGHLWQSAPDVGPVQGSLKLGDD